MLLQMSFKMFSEKIEMKQESVTVSDIRKVDLSVMSF